MKRFFTILGTAIFVAACVYIIAVFADISAHNMDPNPQDSYAVWNPAKYSRVFED